MATTLEELFKNREKTTTVKKSEQKEENNQEDNNQEINHDDNDFFSSIKKKIDDLGLEIVKPGVALQREDELNDMFNLVNNNQNVMVLGEAGVGKTQLISGLAQKLTDSGKVIVSINASYFSGGTVGDEAKALNKLLNKFSPEEMKHIVFFMDEIHSIANQGTFGKGDQDQSAVRNLLKPYLTGNAEKRIVLIGATTTKEYNERIQGVDQAFARRFKNITIESFSLEQIVKVLKDPYSIDYFEKAGFVKGTSENDKKYNQIIEYSCNLLNEYLPYQGFPKKAFQFLEYILSGKNIEQISQDQISKSFSEYYNIPLEFITKKIDKDSVFITSEDKLKSKIIGQEQSIETLSENVRSFVQSPSVAPLSFLSVGSTGVGKTETAEKLAEQLDLPFIKFNMGELKNAKEVQVFTDSLQKHIRNNYAGLILFDEIEKADPEVLDTVLALLDKGEVGSGFDRVKSKGQIIILTTNLLQKELGECSELLAQDGIDKIPEDLIRALLLSQSNLRPEFLGRIGTCLPYNNLSHENYLKIAVNVLNKDIDEHLKSGHIITINPDDRAKIAELLIEGTTSGGVRQIIKQIDSLFVKVFSDKDILANLENPVWIGEINKTPNHIDIKLNDDKTGLNIIVNEKKSSINHLFSEKKLDIDKILNKIIKMRPNTQSNGEKLEI